MNEMTRNIDTITAEIVVIRENAKKVFFSAVIDIGKRLLEAKELVPQGEWLHYLDTALGYKPSTAQNYMRIAKEFAADQIGLDGRSQSEVFGELGYSQLLPLLGLPEEERRAVAEENDLPSMSSREIEKLVSDYKAAQAALENAESQREKAEEAAEKADKALTKAQEAEQHQRDALDAAEKKAKELEGRVARLMEEAKAVPIPATATVVPDEEALEAARDEVRQEMARQISEAEEKARQAEERLAKAKNPTALRVNLGFEQVQADLEKLKKSLLVLETESPEAGAKFRTAIKSYLEAW